MSASPVARLILRGILVIFFLSFARSTPAWGDEEPPAMIEYLDPYWVGASATFQYTQSAFGNIGDSHVGYIQPQIGYGWDWGGGLDVLVPIEMVYTHPFNPAQAPPFVGGGSVQKFEIDANVRFWGDAYDYLGMSVGAGLPWQTNSFLQASSLESWTVPVVLRWRVHGSVVAWKGSFQENINFGNAIPDANGVKLYYDESNREYLVNQIQFWSENRFSPYLTWSENFPYSNDYGTTTGYGGVDTDYLIGRQNTGRTTTFSLGFYWNPKGLPAVFQVQASYNAIEPSSTAAPVGFTGILKWLF